MARSICFRFGAGHPHLPAASGNVPPTFPILKGSSSHAQVAYELHTGLHASAAPEPGMLQCQSWFCCANQGLMAVYPWFGPLVSPSPEKHTSLFLVAAQCHSLEHCSTEHPQRFWTSWWRKCKDPRMTTSPCCFWAMRTRTKSGGKRALRFGQNWAEHYQDIVVQYGQDVVLEFAGPLEACSSSPNSGSSCNQRPQSRLQGPTGTFRIKLEHIFGRCHVATDTATGKPSHYSQMQKKRGQNQGCWVSKT